MIKIYCVDDGNSIIEIDGNTLSGISLRKRTMHRAMLFDQDLSKTDFTGSNLRGAFMNWSNLCQTIFEDANLITSYMSNAHLRESILVRARLNGASLDNANLIFADLSSTDVWGADFKGANLIGAICKFDRYDKAEFEGAIYDDRTVWPEGFDPVAKGAIKVSNRDGVEAYNTYIKK